MKRSELLELAAGPMGFKEAMFRAVEEGRKTQTRRIVNPQPGPLGIHPAMKEQLIEKAKYQPGGIYYLPEQTWIICKDDNKSECRIKYTWTGHEHWRWVSPDDIDRINARKRGWSAPTTARFMLKSFAREFVRIKGVRVERLQDITEQDAIAEGCEGEIDSDFYAKIEFTELWNSIHGADAWSANPWVWVYEFERVEVPCG